MLKSVKVPISEIEEGYILDEDIIKDNVLLLSKGMVITAHRKELLAHRKSVRVVMDIVVTDDYLDESLKDDCVIEFSDETKAEICSRLEDLYENAESGQAVEAAAGISDTIVNDVMSKDGVGINLAALKVSDEYTFKHSVDVAAMAITLGKNMGLSKESLTELGTAGIMHDIGKIKIPNEILNKRGKLTDGEFRIIKSHPVYGYQMLKDMDVVSENVRRGILHHHERYYGGGYPANIKGTTIPLYARILCVVDVFDALVTDRPYHKARTLVDAIEIMYTMCDHFDMDIFKKFLSSLIPFPIGSVVTLTNGVKCQIVGINEGYPLRPLVKNLEDGETIDLATNLDWLSVMIENPGFVQ
ncbi:MAG: HD-GYP domain-containing protein [Lachnospiraceae bacterium]|nr:HD-GYP domain-containing protein [Lachnospiraceae bacterium]